jgi:predicted ATPase
MAARLPAGWIATQLRDVCLPVSTIEPRESPDTEFTYFDIGSIDASTNRIVEAKMMTGLEAPSRARQSVRLGDILFSTVRTYLRKIARVDRDYPNPVASTGFAVIRPVEGVLSEFLYYQFLSNEFSLPLNALQSGTSYPAVRARDILSQAVVIPPTAEQERIVSRIRTSFSALQRAEAATSRARDRLERYRTAVLSAASSGELTREWRARRSDPENGQAFLATILKKRRARWETTVTNSRTNIKKESDSHKRTYPTPLEPNIAGHRPLPSGWTWASADQLTDATRPITYGVIKLGSDVRNGTPVLRSSDVKHLRLNLDGVKRVAKRIAAAYARTTLRGSEVLVTIRGSLGGVVAVPRACAGFNISREVAMLALVDPRTSMATAYFIAAAPAQDWLRSRAKGIAYTGINIETLRALPLPVPPLSEQLQIAEIVRQRLLAAERLTHTLARQLERSRATKTALLRDAFAGRLTSQEPADEPAEAILTRAHSEQVASGAKRPTGRRAPRGNKTMAIRASTRDALTSDQLKAAFVQIGARPDARRLFTRAGCQPDDVQRFYEILRETPDVRAVFEQESRQRREPQPPFGTPAQPRIPTGRFRLSSLWLEDFKNLKDYTIRFDAAHGLDIILGWNGTGKSNLFESLVIIFRDLHDWSERNRWPAQGMNGYRLSYEIDDQLIDVTWDPKTMKRPAATTVRALRGSKAAQPESIGRVELPLPKFVFGYYSGPTNRLAEHFLPMKQAHYARLREATADDAHTLAALLEQRRFFCAETHHAKYVLLAFSYKEDAKINDFLRTRLRVVAFESALFIVRKPAWAKPGSKPDDFWGATGIMRRVMERLRRYAIAPMLVKQTVSDGYRTSKEDHYYFFLPDLQSLHAFAAEYQDARTFFLALESTDFSELIYDVKIQVRVRANTNEQVAITFHQMSEGEQQLLMVLGLMRFTKSHQSLLLLDEPDTHLNPHWSVGYLKDLTRVMSDGDGQSPEQQSSQLLMATHDPLVIASLVKEQVHLMTRDPDTGACRWVPASVNPRGLGFTGILTSEMFGFRSDLDEETLADLDDRVRLVAKQGALSGAEEATLKEVDERLADAGFAKAFSDPYYAAFVRAWGRRHSALVAGKQVLNAQEREDVDRVATEALKEAVAEIEKETHE